MQTSDLVGKNVVLAGTLSTMLRATAQKLLTAAGAIVGTGVTPTTDLVFLGYNGERLAEKARSQGTAVMDELEMRALLVAAGQLPGPRKEPVADPAEMRRVVEELWTFLEALAQREDIRVGVAVLGRPAGTYELDQLRVQRVPTDLVQLYAEVDGVHIEWRFVDPPGGGCMRIPAISQWSRFTTDEGHYMNFGDDQEAMLFDEITPEGSTWLVRDTGSEGGTLRFASAAEGQDSVMVAVSIVDYLRKAMENGLVPYWPRCFKPSRYVSYADEERAIERFRAPAGR